MPLFSDEHADAVFGLDEIRMVQNVSRNSPLRTSPPPAISSEEFFAARKREVMDCIQDVLHPTISKKGSMGQDPAEKSILKNGKSKSHPLAAMYDEVIVHCYERAMNAIQNSFPWLVSKGKGEVPRFVSQLRFESFDLSLDSKFLIDKFYDDGSGLEVIPLPVDHGADFKCAGFQFGRKDVVVYISDVSRIPEETMEHLRSIPRIRLFVIDTLRPINYEKATRPMVHFDLADALQSIRQLGKPPVETYLVGLGHEFDYYSTNEMLARLPPEIYGKVRCGRDGLCLDLDL